MTDEHIPPEPPGWSVDIRAAVAALVRWQLAEHHHDAGLARFMSEPWTVRLRGSFYVVSLDLDGTLLASVGADDVAWAVGIARAKRGDAIPALVN